MRSLRVFALLTGVTLVASGLTGCSSDSGPDPTLQAFLKGWSSGQLDKVTFVSPAGGAVPASDVLTQLKAFTTDLTSKAPVLASVGKPKVTKDIATAQVKVDWTLAGDVHWSYQAAVRLSKAKKNDWRVIWEPTDVHPQLTAGDTLAVRRTSAERGSILDGAGEPIVQARPVVVVGVAKQNVDNIDTLIVNLADAFKTIKADVGDIDLSTLKAQVQKATPTAFNEIVTLREEVYNKIRSRIRDLPGTVFRNEQLQLAPTRSFARALLGTVDDATKEDIDKSAGAYVLGDKIGHSGLQGKYEQQLRGTPAENVVIARKAPDGTVTDTTLFPVAAKPGATIKTTLDQKAQKAADAALATDTRTTALVAIRISDGAVVAAANGPNGGSNNLAFTAQVPPGSTYKVISALGLLDKGAVTLDGPVNCPKTITVDGQTYHNSESFELGSVPFRTDFAKSCNTAFASLASKLGADGLAAASAEVGIGGQWDMGIDVSSGKVSAGSTPAELAQAAFGQGATHVSPLAMAAVAAAIARGQWKQPELLLDPAPAKPAADGPQLKASTLTPLRTVMREVITKGTATSLASVPGKPVYGKTGTAEYDSNPAHAHSWFMGYQGDIAFAVFIENGGLSTKNSVPLAAKFLNALN
jgi:cell division protein FtsI/penicillin-binding protein 2